MEQTVALLGSFMESKYLQMPNFYTLSAYSVYYFYICLASIVIPGTLVKGHPKPKRGPQLTYYINGFRITLLTIAIALLFGGIFPELKFIQVFRIRKLVDEFWPLFWTVNLFAFGVSTFLYIKGIIAKSFFGEWVDIHTHGSFGLDFWVGKQLNPRLGSFDIKFVAYRVAMIFWLIINLAFMAKQYEQYHTITFRMISYQIATGFYILDYFWNEQKMLTTWDIISQQFGHMLVFGDYVFIPFVFSVQCHYLLGYPDFDNIYMALIILVLYFIGFYIFRAANSQKNQYKTQPNKPIWGKKPQTIDGKLLIAGFWGIGRHMNYTGDLIMAIAYCLPCGAQLGGYTYAIYLFILLTHRAYRDDTKCRQKYGLLWVQYCKRVKYVYIPFSPIDFLLQSLGKCLYWMTNKQDIVSKTKSN